MIVPKWRPLSFLGLRPTGDLGPLTGYTSKRRKLVWFLKAPPTKPPTPWQVSQRNKFRLVASTWQSMTAAAKEQWHLAEVRTPLNITGYNLFVYWCLTGDQATIKTIEHLSGTNLIS